MIISLVFCGAILSTVSGCADHDFFSPLDPGYLGSNGGHVHTLNKRMQPGATVTTTVPEPLHWGQINFLSTTDTHGWLAGHLLDPNYSGDYGDFSSFVQRMKQQADERGVDLLLIDSGDLHDGTGLSDTTTPDGAITNPVFAKLPYDLLAPGNHELYVSSVALDTYHNFAPGWRGKYLASNVEIYDDDTGELVPLSDRYRYFTTKHGLRIQSFGFIFNFTGNSNQSVVTKVGDAVQQPWFQEQVARQDIDLFLIAGHIPVRASTEWQSIYRAIRLLHPVTPIQFYGGHDHVRDFVIYDTSATGLSAGRYCETVGWVSLDGFNRSTASTSGITGTRLSQYLPVPGVKPHLNSSIGITRQYLDFNRVTFEYHTGRTNITFDTPRGRNLTNRLTQLRLQRNLTSVIGCSPGSYFLNRFPISHPKSLFNYLANVVFPKIVVAPERTEQPRIILTNTGGFRYDLLEGQFTLDSAYQVNPFTNLWLYMTVPWASAKGLIGHLQTGLVKRGLDGQELTDGYVTHDDLGVDGDNTPHTPVGVIRPPPYVQGNASLPADLTDDSLVDVYVTSFFSASAGLYLEGNTTDWTLVEPGFTTFQTLLRMADRYWNTTCAGSADAPAKADL